MAEGQKDGPKQKFFLVSLNSDEDDTPRCTSFDKEADFVAAVETIVLKAKKPIYAFAFKGERITISAPRPVCILNIDGAAKQIGTPTSEYEESGRVVPLVAPDPTLPSDA